MTGSFALRFIALHLASAAMLFLVPFKPVYLLVFALMHCLKTVGITVGYHRYFSHRSFDTSRAFQFVLAAWGSLAGQRGPLWWAAVHRNHHRFSDTEKDFHSPRTLGFWGAHIGWVLRKDSLVTREDLVSDFLRFPELVLLNKHPNILFGLHLIVLFALGGWGYVLWGGLLATLFECHCSLLVNSAAHLWGSRPFQNLGVDRSGNLWWLAALTFGEGWHNNHHRYPRSARFSVKRFEIDPGYGVIWVLRHAGLIWNVRDRGESRARGASTAKADVTLQEQ